MDDKVSYVPVITNSPDRAVILAADKNPGFMPTMLISETELEFYLGEIRSAKAKFSNANGGPK